jgi:transcriptional regulator with XRE-family HTH domain
MPFDPITLMREEGFEPFPDAIGAFAGLSDVLAVGGKFQHPADALFAYRMKGVLDSGHTPEFWDFWQPMLDEYEVWAHSGAMDSVVPLRRHSVAFKDQIDSIQDNTLKSERFEGGWDPLHLTSHAWRPFRRAFLEETEARVEISGQDFYRVLTTDSYAGWARALMDHSFERSTLIRIDVNLDTTGPREALFATLGHVLVEPVPRLISTDDYRYEDDDLQSQSVIRYLNDSQVQELVRSLEAKRIDPARSIGDVAEGGRFYGFTFIYTTPDRRPTKEGRLFGTEALVLVTDGTEHKFILPYFEGGNWYRLFEEDINEIIGAKVRSIREAAGLTQRELGDLLGVSDQKILSLELGRTRALVSDIVQIAAAVHVSPLSLLEGVIDVPDLGTYLAMHERELAALSSVPIEHMTTAVMWLSRYYRLKYHMDYRPVFYLHPTRPPIEFFEEWVNPVLSGERKILYLAKEPSGIAGYFFAEEIVPAPTPEMMDFPPYSSITSWNNEDEVKDFLEKNGYCWQFYPIKSHHEAYCSLAHRAEIEAKRGPATKAPRS